MLIKSQYYPSISKVACSITSVNSDGEILLFDIQTNESSKISLPQGCGRAFDISSDGKLLATGYWYRRGIDIWDLESKKIIETFGPSRVSRIVFDESSRYVVYHSDKGTYIKKMGGDQEIRLNNISELDGASLDRRTNSLWIPTTRKGKLVFLSFESLVSEIRDLQISAQIYWVRQSPRKGTYFLIDSKKRIYCFGESMNNIIWENTILEPKSKGIAYLGSHSGNGGLIGITVTEFDGFRTVVLDAATGNIMNEFADVRCIGCPYGENEVYLESGSILDLTTGIIRESLPTWVATYKIKS